MVLWRRVQRSQAASGCTAHEDPFADNQRSSGILTTPAAPRVPQAAGAASGRETLLSSVPRSRSLEGDLSKAIAIIASTKSPNDSVRFDIERRQVDMDERRVRLEHRKARREGAISSVIFIAELHYEKFRRDQTGFFENFLESRSSTQNF